MVLYACCQQRHLSCAVNALTLSIALTAQLTYGQCRVGKLKSTIMYVSLSLHHEAFMLGSLQSLGLSLGSPLRFDTQRQHTSLCNSTHAVDSEYCISIQLITLHAFN